jgi:hypothetical protein
MRKKFSRTYVTNIQQHQSLLVPSKLGAGYSWNPTEATKSRFKHVDSCFHVLLFKAKALDILYLFKSSFTVSSHVNFDFSLSSYYYRALRTHCALVPLRWTRLNHLSWYSTSFSSIYATHSLSHVSSFRTLSFIVWLCFLVERLAGRPRGPTRRLISISRRLGRLINLWSTLVVY